MHNILDCGTYIFTICKVFTNPKERLNLSTNRFDKNLRARLFWLIYGLDLTKFIQSDNFLCLEVEISLGQKFCIQADMDKKSCWNGKIT